MTDCPNGDIRDLLPDLLHGRLDASDRARVEQHVASCDDCRAELALLRDLRSTIRRAPVVDTAAIAAAIPAYRAPVRHRSWGGWRTAAAIAAIAVGGTSLTLVTRERSAGAPPAVVAQRPTVAPVPGASVAPANSSSSTGQRATGEAPSAPIRTRDVEPSSTVAEPVSLAMTGGAIGELSDRELSTLVDEIETLDALPSEDVESAASLESAVPLESTR